MLYRLSTVSIFLVDTPCIQAPVYLYLSFYPPRRYAHSLAFLSPSLRLVSIPFAWSHWPTGFDLSRSIIV